MCYEKKFVNVLIFSTPYSFSFSEPSRKKHLPPTTKVLVNGNNLLLLLLFVKVSGNISGIFWSNLPSSSLLSSQGPLKRRKKKKHRTVHTYWFTRKLFSMTIDRYYKDTITQLVNSYY